jgi:hypothetical protein
MGISAHVIDDEAKMNIDRSDLNTAMVRVYFNAGGSNLKRNFFGWVPEHYMVRGQLNEGMAKVMSMAGIKKGWLNSVEKAGGDFHLIDFALVVIAEKAAKGEARLAARKRRVKA